MKKTTLATIAALMITTSATACPLWECNYDYNDYSCGCQQVAYHTDVQPIYCQYCGYEQWNCQCDQSYTIQCDGETYYEDEMTEEPEVYYQECSYDESAEGNYDCNYNYSYSGSGCVCMAQWANIRNSCGVIIAQAGAGDLIDICGTEADTGRTLIYDQTIGVYGSVLSECIYGTYTWDGSGDNGVYNQYNGASTCGSCGYAVSSCVCTQTCAYQPVYCAYVSNCCY